MCLQRPIEPDHLGSPRKVLEPSRGTALWDWPILGNAFGTAAANEDADGDGIATPLNLRFPGQQYDPATGLHYNYFRDYDPSTGRYVESDPIGLKGGVATFVYSKSSPIEYSDSFGKRPCKKGMYNTSNGCKANPKPTEPPPPCDACNLCLTSRAQCKASEKGLEASALAASVGSVTTPPPVDLVCVGAGISIGITLLIQDCDMSPTCERECGVCYATSAGN
jgi:RHS repeat-associated protein